MSSKDRLLLVQCYYRRKPKLTLFMLDSTISSNLLSVRIVSYWSATSFPGHFPWLNSKMQKISEYQDLIKFSIQKLSLKKLIFSDIYALTFL